MAFSHNISKLTYREVPQEEQDLVLCVARGPVPRVGQKTMEGEGIYCGASKSWPPLNEAEDT